MCAHLRVRTSAVLEGAHMRALGYFPTKHCWESMEFAPPAPPKQDKPAREKKPKEKVKIDPQLVAKARELRDRYLEHVNGEQADERLLLASRGKYDVSRAPAERTQRALPSAA